MLGLSRRDFLKLASQALLVVNGFLGLSALFRYLGFQTEPASPTTFDLGPAANYPLGSRTLLPDIPALLVHTETGFQALSLTCTHLGCTLKQEADAFICPCHGSRFHTDGQVARGPAEEPLAKFQVALSTEGSLVLYAWQDAVNESGY